MALESATYIDDLVDTNPTATDDVSEGDDHIRLLKSTIQATFPNVTGEVSLTHSQLNQIPTLGTEQATTSGTEIDFTSIPSWATKIEIMFEGVSLSGTAYYALVIGDADGFETSGYTGGSGSLSFVDGSVTNTAAGAGANIAFGDATAGTTLSGVISLYLKDSTNNTWVFDGRLFAGNVHYFVWGNKDLSATLDSVRITTSNGTDTFDAGSINIRYY